MSDVIFKTKVDDFLARRVKDIIKETVRIHEFRKLEERMWKTSLKIASKHPMSISDALLLARAEEDYEL